ncbi:MAG: hypothetical protein ACRCVK_08340 [Aeromonas veronii]
MKDQFSTLTVAEIALGDDVMRVVLEEVKTLPTMWSKVDELTQQAFLERLADGIRLAARKGFVELLGCGFPSVPAALDVVTFKRKGVKASMHVSFDDGAMGLAPYAGGNCVIVLADVDRYVGMVADVQADAQQRALALDNAAPLEGWRGGALSPGEQYQATVDILLSGKSSTAALEAAFPEVPDAVNDEEMVDLLVPYGFALTLEAAEALDGDQVEHILGWLRHVRGCLVAPANAGDIPPLPAPLVAYIADLGAPS